MSARVAMTEWSAELVTAAVRDVPAVAALHAGPYNEVGTHLPGRRIPGVRLWPDRCEVHVAVWWDCDLPDVADQVRWAVAEVTGVEPEAVDVVIEDVVDPKLRTAVEPDDAPVVPEPVTGARDLAATVADVVNTATEATPTAVVVETVSAVIVVDAAELTVVVAPIAP